MAGRVKVEQHGRKAQLVLDHAAAKNALTEAMLDQLIGVVGDLSTDDTADVVVISGAGTDFCSGSDVGDITAVLAEDAAGRKASFESGLTARIHPLMRTLMDLPQVVVASARGHAVGLGAAIVLAADLTVLSETICLTLPQVALGHTVDHGESYLLPRKVGPARAMQMVLLGSSVTATDAAQFGLANFVSADDRLEERTNEIVEALLAGSPASIRGTKRILSGSLDRDRATQLAVEVEAVAACAYSEDFVSAIRTKLGGRTSARSR